MVEGGRGGPGMGKQMRSAWGGGRRGEGIKKTGDEIDLQRYKMEMQNVAAM